MFRFPLLTFGFLGWAFFEVSGGEEFVPPAADPVSVPNGLVKDAEFAIDEGRRERAIAFALYVSALDQDLVSGQLPTPEEALLIIDPPTPEEIQLASAVVSTPKDLREVTGNRVNLRGGPGTGYGVVGKLIRGQQVEILEDAGRWVQLRDLDSGQIAWMAASLLRQIGSE